MKGTSTRIFKFGTTGLVATATHGTIYTLLCQTTNVTPITANTAAFLLAFAVSLYGNTYWTFADLRQNEPVPVFKFAVATLIGFGLNTLFAYGIVTVLGSHYILSVMPMLIVTPVATYLLHRYWVFKESTVRA